jgi:hypothetical protein
MKLKQVKKGLLHPRLAARFLINNGGEQLLRRTFDDSGIKILDRDWDTLVIFDCARYDVFDAVVDLPGTLSKERSLASVTANFVKRNFRDREAHDVVYLSANPAVGSREEFLDVYKFVGVWHESERDARAQENRRGLTDPEPVIKKAWELHEEYPNKRHIVHVLPPHVPHLFREGEQLDEDSPYRNYEAARENEVSAADMHDVYAENLEYVVQETIELIESIEGKVVLTADHGELLGEGMPMWMKACHNRWGNQWHKYDFGHYSNVDVPELVEIPWMVQPYNHRRDIISEEPITDEYDTKSIENKLEALGYRT